MVKQHGAQALVGERGREAAKIGRDRAAETTLLGDEDDS